MKRLSLALMLLFSTTLCVVSTAQKHRNHLEKTEQTTATTVADTVGNSVDSIANSVDSDFDDDGFDGRFDNDEARLNDLKFIEKVVNVFQTHRVFGGIVLALMIICSIVAVLLPVILLIVLLRYIIKRRATKAQLECTWCRFSMLLLYSWSRTSIWNRFTYSVYGTWKVIYWKACEKES